MYLLQVVYISVFVTMALACGRSKPPRQCPPRDTTKPILTCPPNIDTVADPIQVNKKVTWEEPTAYDDRDGPITPKRTGRKPGLLFYGRTQITYSAIDKSSNYATCSFWINVRVITCRRWTSVSNGWKKCHPSVQMRYGGRCVFGCYDGHELVGPTQTNCLETGNWDVASQPYCQKLTCPSLLPTNDQYDLVTIQCSDTNYYRSQCTYTCAEGYNVLPGKNRVRVCGANGNWVGDRPICVDRKIPEFTNCPYVKTGYADQYKNTSLVLWDTPMATDNSGSVTVTQTYGPVSGTDLLVGEYDVIYKAMDDAGKLALCEFQVIVKQISCHTIYPLPYTSVLCPNGKIYGSSCTFACTSNNTVMNGTSRAVCNKTGTTIQYGYWNFGDHQSYCQLTSSCPELTPPINGALACDTWLAGTFCQMFCQDNYVVMDEDKTYLHKRFLVCGNGTWSLGSDDGTIEFPDCQETSQADQRDKNRFSVDVELYYAGTCTSDNTKIMEAFRGVLARVGQCNAPDCVVDNVNVECGTISKRSADNHDGLDRNKRSTNDITIHVTLVVTKDTTGVKHPLQQKYDIEKSLKESVANDELTLIVDGSTYEVTSLDVSRPMVTCDEGLAPDNVHLQCVVCSVGHYHHLTSQTCARCPRGYYQDQSKQTSCKQCPIGATTESTGARSLAMCLDACAPGYFSTLGTTPCSPCNPGYHSGKNGTTECTVCPGSKITLTSGAVSEDQCHDFDVKYTILDEGQTVVPATVTVMNDDINDQLYLSVWVKCSQCDSIVTITNTDGDHILYIAQQQQQQQHEIKTLLGSTSYSSEMDITKKDTWTNIQIQWTLTTITILINGQETVTENNTSSFSNFVSNQVNVAIGGVGFIGSVSQLNIWKSSTSYIETASTQCSPNVHGDWLAWKRFAETDGSFVFTNSKCDDFDNCEGTPCLNDGMCSDALDGFTCACKEGFTGSSCDVNIDDCQGISPCDNDGVCLDGENSFNCNCTKGFSGTFCEIKVVNGNWAIWDDWSACSVSCGTGSQSRSRVCDDPAPDNGGLDCEGESQEIQECIIENCEINECLQDPPAITNGDLNCVWIASDNDTRECSPTCHDGYDFDSVTYIQDKEIICGSDTSFVWNIENNILPSCNKKQKATRNTLKYTPTYPDLHKVTDDVEKKIKDVVNSSIADHSCLKTDDCSIENINVYLSDADADGIDEGTRRKRSTSTVAFTVHLSCVLSSTNDIKYCYNQLADIVTVLDELIEQLGLTINIGGIDYNVGLNTSSLDGTSVCADGYVPVYEYCIPCGEGMYQDGIFCQRCDVGYYQDTQGQSSCKQCPLEWTTSGLQSKHVSYCKLPVDLPLSSDSEDESKTTLIVILIVVLVGVASLVGLAIVLIRLLLKRKPKIQARAVTPTGSHQDAQELNRLGLGNLNAKVAHRYLQSGNDNDMFRSDIYNTQVIENKEGRSSSLSTINVTPWGPVDLENDSGNI